MIEVPTTLVLGAGASIPYGFPSGPELYERVLKSLKKSAFLDILAALGHDRNAAREFREGLVMSGVRSVDAFLEHREEFVDLGKLCIARGVMMREDPGRITDSNARSAGWYHYVWDILRCARNRWTDNQLRFVTFNYDRSLEFFLWNAIKTTYKASDEETKGLMLVVPVCHVHGDLGEFDPSNPSGAEVRPYEPEVLADTLRLASERIQIVTESGAGQPGVSRARQLIQESQRVFFVGMGYHDGNLSKIGVRELGPEVAKRGSSFGMEGAERNRVVSQWRIQLDDTGADALGFFRSVVTL